MNKTYILALAITLPSSAIAADTDSVHTWGAWAQNIQPAAGPTARVTPSPVIQPKVNFRPNENPAFNRAVATVIPPVTPLVQITGASDTPSGPTQTTNPGPASTPPPRR